MTAKARVLEAIQRHPDSPAPVLIDKAGVCRGSFYSALGQLIGREVITSSTRPEKRKDGRTRTVPHFAPMGWKSNALWSQQEVKP